MALAKAVGVSQPIVQRVGEDRANVILQSLRNQLVLKQELPDRVVEIFGQFDTEDIDTNISEHVLAAWDFEENQQTLNEQKKAGPVRH